MKEQYTIFEILQTTIIVSISSYSGVDYEYPDLMVEIESFNSEIEAIERMVEWKKQQEETRTDDEKKHIHPSKYAIIKTYI